ncbi:MAG TPA: lamin tail domain-containing protein [Candidatus Limnocylindria bacterium]|nr:lamin tail domain-containing protein [Candidatus Limnocylindria bacterium]
MGLVAATAMLLASLVVSFMAATGAAGWTHWSAEAPAVDRRLAAAEPVGHLVVSEVQTGGASASDEFIEIYNPSTSALSLEGLEAIYVSASGATISRKAAWPAGAPVVPPGGHVLIANEAGAHAAAADVAYANGLAATGGSVAIRIQGAGTALDALGWGNAANAWMEGAPAAAVAAGHSLERLPGGAAASGQDTNDNATDFVDRSLPDPQNAAAPAIPVEPTPQPSSSGDASPTAIETSAPTASGSGQSASPTASPTIPTSPTPTPIRTPTPTAQPTPTLTPAASPTPTATASTATPTPVAAISIAEARALPDGSVATIEGVAITDSTFADGGGYVTDGSAGIAVLTSGATFPRASRVRITGELDDRYHQRTLRAEAEGIAVIGPASEPATQLTTTGAVGEELEGELVEVSASIASSPGRLSGAVAFDLDDGSGPTRLVVLDASGIDSSAWERGTRVRLRGVVGQRDSSGSGTEGYRFMPRDGADVLEVRMASASPSPSSSASPDPSGGVGFISLADARRQPFNADVRVRGVVTLPTSVLGDGTAAIQDSSGAMILRLGDEAGHVEMGQLLELTGVRSTKSGMETIRLSEPPAVRGSRPLPEPARHSTGSLGEAHEALLVTVRGTVTTAPRRTSAQNVYFDVDDGSGPLRVFVSPNSAIATDAILLGSWLEITGVLGQETSGQQPLRGYRLWPRVANDLRIVSPPGTIPAGSGASRDTSGDGGDPAGGPAAGGVPAPGAAGSGERPQLRSPQLRARLVAATQDAERTPSPGRASVGSSRDEPAHGVAPIVLALVAAALASLGAIAAARPGLLDRLRALLERRQPAADQVGDEREDSTDEPPLPGIPRSVAPGPRALSPLEASVARLVPLSVDQPEPRSTASRSEVRRILPPT